jgi:hypothetical protein
MTTGSLNAPKPGAHYLVTGNRRHFPERWKMTRVVTPREFFEAFDPGGELG